jgi:hypothetical protein
MNKSVKTNQDRIVIPPNGYVTELAKLCVCSRATVFNALRKNSRGEKADCVRAMYRSKYVTHKTETP